MKKEKWEQLQAAAKILDLGDRCSLNEVRQQYRRLAKKLHPDTRTDMVEDSEGMQELTEAYQLLLDYCSRYPVPLEPDGNEPMDAEEWWMDRFGVDPLWGPGGQ
jgi:preprotein translocase subunit Sec63